VTIDLDIKLTKLLIPLANVKGSVQVDLIAENLTHSFVQSLVLDGLREKGFTGDVIIDGERISLDSPSGK
jgi:hypothetical protein